MWYGLPGPDGHFQRLGGDPELKRIPRGAVELTEAQHQQLKADRKALWYQDGVVKAVDNSAVLEEAKARLKRRVKALLERKLEHGGNYPFPDGVAGRVALRNNRDVLHIIWLGTTALMIQSLPTSRTLKYRDADGNAHELTPAQAIEFAVTVHTRYTAWLDAAWTHKLAVEALATLGEVASYDITAGWPG